MQSLLYLLESSISELSSRMIEKEKLGMINILLLSIKGFVSMITLFLFRTDIAD